VININLRKAMSEHSSKIGKKVTYADIAAGTGLSKATLEALGSRNHYNTTLATVDSLCKFFECDLSDLLEYRPAPESMDSVDDN